MSGKKVDTTYKHDVFGNQVENSSSEGNKAIDSASKKVTSFINGIGGNSSNKGGGSKSSKPPVKKVKVEAKCPEKERSGWDKFWDGVVDAGKSAWNGIKDFGSAIWGKIRDAGAFVAKKGKEFLSWVDAALDTVAKVGSVVVFVAGAIAVGATFAATLPALAGATILGASIGAIGYVAGSLALYGGMAMMAVDGTQIISGASGYRLDGSRLTKSQAQARIQNGMTNMSLAVSGTMMGGTALNNNSYTGKGASGAIERINAENLKYSNSAWYDNRPYQKSPITIQNIIDSCSPGADPKGSAGLWWKVDGAFNGSQGTYELLISPDKTTIWHFLFRSK